MNRRQNRFQPQLSVKVYHEPEAKPIMVKRISIVDIALFWLPHHRNKKVDENSVYYIECNSAGIIFYEEAAIFTSSELVGRDNVKQILS